MIPAWRIRLKQAMEARNVTAKELSRLTGMNERLVYDLLTKTTNPRIKTLDAVANALGMTAAELRDGTDPAVRSIPIIGVATAGEGWAVFSDTLGEVELTLDPGESIAIEVKGDSMAPVYRDGDIIVGTKRSGANAQNLIGLDCIVETDQGARFIKYLSKGTMRGRFNLRSYNPHVQDIENVRLVWAAPVAWIKRGGR